MLSSWVLHRFHFHRGNTSTENDKMYCLKGLSHEIDFKNFDKKLHNLA
jgi:hypothetical protein